MLKIYEYTLFSSTVFAGRGYRYDLQRWLHEAFRGVLMLATVYEHGLVGCMGTVSYVNKDSESSAFRWVGISHGYTMSAMFGEWEGVDTPCYLMEKGCYVIKEESLVTLGIHDGSSGRGVISALHILSIYAALNHLTAVF